MADKHSRNILLYVLLQVLSRIHAMKTSLEVAVEGHTIEIECTTNSSFGVDWMFKNATKEYGIYHEGIVPDPFKMEYSVTNVDYSSYRIFYLSIAQVKLSNVGTYNCLHGENRQILTSVDLAILTIPVCELETNSTETIRRYVCNFTFISNISSRSEWIGDFCTNSTPTPCTNVNEGGKICDFPINRNNRTSLQFATNAMSHGIEVCEIGCKNDNETSTNNLSMSVNISAFLQCRVNPNRTTAKTRTTEMPANSPKPIENHFYLYGSIAVSTVGVLLTIIIIVICRNRDACSCKNKSRTESKNQQSPEEQIAANPIYHELESAYAEIPDSNISEYRFQCDSDPNVLYPTNHSHESVPASHIPTQLDNPKLLRKDTHEAETALVSSEYAEPHDRVASLPYATVYGVNAKTMDSTKRSTVIV